MYWVGPADFPEKVEYLSMSHALPWTHISFHILQLEDILYGLLCIGGTRPEDFFF